MWKAFPEQLRWATSTLNLTNGESDVIKVHVRRKADIPIAIYCSVWKHNQCSTAWTIPHLIPSLVFHCWNETLQHPEQEPAAFLLTLSSCSFLNVTFLMSHLIKSWIIEYVANMSNDESDGLKKRKWVSKEDKNGTKRENRTEIKA